MSVNIEIPTQRNLRLLAPDKSYESIYRPMSYIQQGICRAPRSAPASAMRRASRPRGRARR